MSYFEFSQKFEDGLDGLRGKFIRLKVDKKDGSERELVGTLCRNENGRFFIDEGSLAEGDFDPKAFNPHKIRQITVNGQIFKPKEN